MSIPSLRASVVRIIESAFPHLAFCYPRTYVVVAVRADKRLDLQPPSDAPHLPELPGVEQWGLGVVSPMVGTEVCVLFRDADPTRPVVVPWGFDSVPDDVKVDADTAILLGDPATRGAARLDDTVASGTWSFVYVSPTLTVTYTPNTGTPTVFTVAVVLGVLTVVTVSGNPASIPMAGKITSASNKTKIE